MVVSQACLVYSQDNTKLTVRTACFCHEFSCGDVGELISYYNTTLSTQFTEQKSNQYASSETSCDITIFAHLHTDENANKVIVLEWWLM